uniref:FAD-binding oxidoreductase n=1 Tax=Stenotrophomonas sp. PS02297 TaxID=2991423 RepID=UPI00249B32BA
MDRTLPAAFDRALSDLLGAHWRTDDAALAAHAQDNSWRHALPLGVALPESREQVQAIVRACRAHGVPLVGRGTGTGTTGAAVPPAGGIVLSFARMNHILALRPGDPGAVVAPGVQ